MSIPLIRSIPGGCRSRGLMRWICSTRTQRCFTQLVDGTTNIQGAIREPNPELVDARQAPSGYDSLSAVVYQDFATVEEAEILADDLKTCLKRRRYEKGHWDAVILKYKETELLDEPSMLSQESQNLLDNVRYQLEDRHLQLTTTADQAFEPSSPWLPCHAIDLHQDGALTAHVDSVRFSGTIVSGLSLLSPSIMRLLPVDGCIGVDEDNSSDDDAKKQEDKNDMSRGWVDLCLPPRSLYVLSGAGRYQYSHQLLPTGSVFHPGNGKELIVVHRNRRLSVIFRDAKPGDE